MAPTHNSFNPVTSRENTLFAARTAMLVSSVAWATSLWRACNVTRTSKVSICQWLFLLCFGQILEYRVTRSVVVLNNNNRDCCNRPQLRLSKLVVLALCGSEFCSYSLCLHDAFWQVTDFYYIILYYIIFIILYYIILYYIILYYIILYYIILYYNVFI